MLNLTYKFFVTCFFITSSLYVYTGCTKHSESKQIEVEKKDVKTDLPKEEVKQLDVKEYLKKESDSTTGK